VLAYVADYTTHYLTTHNIHYATLQNMRFCCFWKESLLAEVSKMVQRCYRYFFYCN